MSKNSLLVVGLVLFLTADRGRGAAEKYLAFPTEEIGGGPVEGTRAYNKALASAQTEADAKPMDDDLAGNWGEVANGCALSVRFGRTQYTTGENLVAHALIRNVGSETLFYPTTFPDLQTKIIILDEGRNLVQPRSERSRDAIVSGGTLSIRPGWQRRFDLDLSSEYDLSRPGSYSISISRPVLSPDGQQILVASRPALLTIVPGTNFPASVAPPVNLVTNPNPKLNLGSPSSPNLDQVRTASVSKSTTETSEPVIPLVPAAGSSPYTTDQKLGTGIIAALVALLLAILWRASRRGEHPKA